LQKKHDLRRPPPVGAVRFRELDERSVFGAAKSILLA
jgi:hypothetical protein